MKKIGILNTGITVEKDATLNIDSDDVTWLAIKLPNLKDNIQKD